MIVIISHFTDAYAIYPPCNSHIFVTYPPCITRQRTFACQSAVKILISHLFLSSLSSFLSLSLSQKKSNTALRCGSHLGQLHDFPNKCNGLVSGELNALFIHLLVWF